MAITMIFFHEKEREGSKEYCITMPNGSIRQLYTDKNGQINVDDPVYFRGTVYIVRQASETELTLEPKAGL